MPKYCPYCGRQNDEAAVVCNACGRPFMPAYAADDDQRTLAADDVYPPRTDHQPAPAPEQDYQQNTPAYAPPASSYTPPVSAPVHTQQPPQYPQPSVSGRQPMTATPLNMSAPRYATPVQQQTYQPSSEKRSKGTAVGIAIAVGTVIVIAAVVLAIVLAVGGTGLKGSYYLDSRIDNGVSYSHAEILAMTGEDITLTIDGDNKGTLSYGSYGTISLTFDPDSKTVTGLDNSIATYTLSGNTLKITDSESGSVSVFIKN